MRHTTLTLPLALALFVGACSSGSEPSTRATASLSADSGVGHPDVFSRVFDSASQVSYWSVSQDDKIHAHWGVASTADLQLNGFFPDYLFLPEEWPGELWVFGHEADGTFALRSFVDTNGDGVVDASSSQQLFSGDRPDRVGDIAFHGASGTLYLLETVTDHVFKAVDASGDSRPDQLLLDPFVDAAWAGPAGGPPVYGTQEDPISGEEVVVPAGYIKLGTGISVAEPDRVRISGYDEWMVDTDGDEVADSVEEIVEIRLPLFVTSLVDGVDRVQLNGDDGATLSFVLEGGGTVGQTTAGGWVQLSTPLVAGQRYKVVDETNQLETEFLQVCPRRIYAHEVGIISVGDPETFTITGANLNLIDQVMLEREGASLPLTFQYISPYEIRVDLPALGTEWDDPTEMALQPAASFDATDPETYPDRVGVERCPHE